MDRLEKIDLRALARRDAVDEHAIELRQDGEVREELVRIPVGFVAGLRLDAGGQCCEPVGSCLQTIGQDPAFPVEVCCDETLDVVEGERGTLDLQRVSD